MKNFNTESLDDLERGIKQLLVEDRCSFSENEIKLLTDCILALQIFKSSSKKKGKPDWTVIVKVAELLFRIFSASDHLKGLF